MVDFASPTRATTGGRPQWVGSTHCLPSISIDPADNNSWTVQLPLPVDGSSATYLSKTFQTFHDLGQFLMEWRFDPEATVKRHWGKEPNSSEAAAGPVNNPADLGL